MKYHTRSVPNARLEDDEQLDRIAHASDIVPTAPTAPSAPADSIGAAEARQSLSSLFEARDGTVARVWTVVGILLCLQLVSTLRPGASLGDNLSYAASLFFLVQAAPHSP